MMAKGLELGRQARRPLLKVVRSPRKTLFRMSLVLLFLASVAAILLIVEGSVAGESSGEAKAMSPMAFWGMRTAADLHHGMPEPRLISFSGASRGVTVDLSMGTVGAVARIMPFGDSITQGVVNRNLRDTGGYRTPLWQMSLRGGGLVEFVGPEKSAVPGPQDPDHAGFGRRTLVWAEEEAPNLLARYRPDVILLMFGTNDSNEADAENMLARAGRLFDRIASESPGTLLLVADPPPIRSDAQPHQRVAAMETFRTLLPVIIRERVEQGGRIQHVSMAALGVQHVSAPPADNGLHPTPSGYCAMAAAWATGLAQSGLSTGYLPLLPINMKGVADITGSAFNDRLVGTAGMNRLRGGRGNDVLIPNGGADELWGGPDADLFVFTTADIGTGVAIVHDFNAEEGDRLDLSSISAAYPEPDMIVFRPTDAGTFLAVDPDGMIGEMPPVEIAWFPGASIGPDVVLEQTPVACDPNLETQSASLPH